MDASDAAGELLLSFHNVEAVRAGMPSIAAAARKVLTESCALETRGIPVIPAEMNPNDYAVVVGDEPSVLMEGQVHIIKLDHNVANQVFEFFEQDCDAI